MVRKWDSGEGQYTERVGNSMSRWIVVPISALIVFGLGVGIAALIGLVWAAMPIYVRWGIPVVMLLLYLFDAMKRESGA